MTSREIVIRVDRKAFIAAAAVVLLSAAAVRLWSESLTLVTTYPAPSGIYNQIVTTGNSGSSPADTTLNRNAGNTILVPPTNPNGKVGIGAVPPSLYRAKLIVGDFVTDGGDYPGTGATTVNINSAVATTHPDNGYQLTLTESGSLGADKGGAIGFQSRYTSGQTYTATFAGIKGRRENATSDNMSGYLQFLTRGALGSNAERMRITSSGNVGIGTTNPLAQLHVAGNVQIGDSQSTAPGAGASNKNLTLWGTLNNVNDTVDLKFRGPGLQAGATVRAINTASGGTVALAFLTSYGNELPAEGMRINHISRVGIGTTDPQASLDIQQRPDFPQYPPGLRVGGTCVSGYCSSDENLKENIAHLSGSLDTILKLKPASFKFKGQDNGVGYGLIAQEVREVAPGLVRRGTDGYLGVDYSSLEMMLIQAVQEQQSRIELQGAEIQSLKSELDALRGGGSAKHSNRPQTTRFDR